MAETEEGLWMPAKERDRLKVLHEVRKRHVTQRQAAAESGMSIRWVRTLMERLRMHGDRVLRHGLRGKRSNHKVPEELKRRAVELYRQKKQARLSTLHKRGTFYFALTPPEKGIVSAG